MNKNIPVLISFIFLLVFGQSCSHTSSNESQVANTDVSDEKKQASVEEKKEDPSQIHGSLKANKKNLHKTIAGKKLYFLYGAEHLNLDNYYFDIPVVYNAAVKNWIKYFLTRGKDFYVRYVERAGRYAPILGKILEDYGLPRDLIFLAMAESGFNNKAKSWAKAVGPWQFMPYTGKRYGLKIDWYVDERRDPIKATIAASRYLKDLYKLFGSWELAAAAYNAGEGKINRAMKRYRSENFWHIRKGRYLKKETRNYVPKIMALAIIGKNLKAFGLKGIEFDEPLDFDEIEIGANTDLFEVAGKLEIPVDDILAYNPELLRWQTPPHVETYKLRVPVGYKVAWNTCCKDLDLTAKSYQIYTIKRSGTSLDAVARKFKVKSHVLASLNETRGTARFKRGEEILLPFREGQSIRDEMYNDLYEKPRRVVRLRRAYKKSIRLALAKGKKIENPTEYYTVQKGDSLWSVAKKFGVSLHTLIRSNLALVGKGRMIRQGDRLVIR